MVLANPMDVGVTCACPLYVSPTHLMVLYLRPSGPGTKLLSSMWRAITLAASAENQSCSSVRSQVSMWAFTL